MSTGPFITILTPTYNRAGTLPALAASLGGQGFRDFEWLVVDDGSTDETARVLKEIEADGTLPLRIIRTANGGKHRALNRGVPEARGEWTFIVDSDDRLPPEALATVARLAFAANGHERLCGIMGLKGDFSGKVVGGLLPLTPGPVDAAALTFTHGVRGDKAEVYKTAVLREYPFPEFEGERFITECVVWYRMARDGYRLFLANELLYLCEYRADGLSARSLQLRLANPRGNLLFYAEELALDFPGRALLREAANLVRFGLQAGMLRETMRGLDGKARRLAVLAFPIGAAAALRDRLAARRRPA